MNKITVIGTGYVGLSLAVLLSKTEDVIALDINEEKVQQINSRKSPIADEYIERFFKDHKLNLNATIDVEKALSDRRFYIIATPTNYDENTNTFDTKSVEESIENILGFNKGDDFAIIIKSTIPIGFTDKMRKKYSFDKIFFSPEFLREGKALYDNLHPSRIVIGTKENIGKEFVAMLNNASYSKENNIIYMDNTEAEAVKLFSNTYLALRVSFFNELDSFSSKNGLNTHNIIQGVSADPRIGDYYNNPSFGYGGYCLPKDTKQLLASYSDIPQNLMSAVVDSNSTRKEFIAQDIISKSSGVIGIYRLVMKADSDNYRSSAIIDIIDYIVDKGYKVIIFEPEATEVISNKYEVINDIDEFLTCSSIIVANRYNDQLNNYIDKVYTKDVYGRD